MGLKENYVSNVQNLFEAVISEEMGKISEASDIISEIISKGDVLHVFGSGHSDILAKEVFQRAGGLACVNKITDTSDGLAERLECWGETLIEKYDLKKGEAIIIISNSGRNPSPLEIAEYAKKRGLKVIAITNLNHSKSTQSRHSSGKKLYEIADVVIDNHGVTGDCAIDIPKMKEKSGPTSTIVGALIMNMIVLDSIEKCIQKGFTPPLIISQNLDGTDEHNKILWEKYRARLGTI